MKRIILFFILFITFACGPTYHLSKSFDKYYVEYQVDSVCNVEKIPIDFSKWSMMNMVSEVDTTYFKQYLFIRTQGGNKVIYTLSDFDTLYRFTKRTLNIEE